MLRKSINIFTEVIPKHCFSFMFFKCLRVCLKLTTFEISIRIDFKNLSIEIVLNKLYNTSIIQYSQEKIQNV